MANINPDMDLTLLVSDEAPKDKETNNGPMFPGEVRPADLRYVEEGVERTVEHWGAFLMRQRVKAYNAKEWLQWIRAEREALAAINEALTLQERMAESKRKNQKVVNSYS